MRQRDRPGRPEEAATVAPSTEGERRFGSTLFWRLFALVNFVTVAWVVWVLWQIAPRTVVNDFVLRLPVSQRSVSGAISGDPSAARAKAAPAPEKEISIQSGPPMAPLRLDTEIKTPPQ